jgi:hypothetical protein
MQRTYELRGAFAKAAAAGVVEFWASDPAFESAEARAAYVKWAVPQSSDPDEEVVIPFIWEYCDDSDPDNPVSGCTASGPNFFEVTFCNRFLLAHSVPNQS